MNNLSDDDWYKTSKEMIEELMEKKGVMDPVDDEDNLQEAFEYILSLLQFPNPFSLLEDTELDNDDSE